MLLPSHLKCMKPILNEKFQDMPVAADKQCHIGVMYRTNISLASWISPKTEKMATVLIRMSLVTSNKKGLKD